MRPGGTVMVGGPSMAVGVAEAALSPQLGQVVSQSMVETAALLAWQVQPPAAAAAR